MAGSVPPNPCKLLGSKKMGDTLAQTCEQYDYVIIDSAPIVPVADSLALSSIVEGVIVVAGIRTRNR
jgi:polysaccharide biosynthesis transport protein